jgi:hypothetical protein
MPAALRTHVNLPKHIADALRSYALGLGMSPTKAVEQIVLTHFTEGEAFRALEKHLDDAFKAVCKELREQQVLFIDALADNLDVLAELQANVPRPPSL